MFRPETINELHPTLEQLEANALAYPVMQQDVSSRDERAIAGIAQELLSVPLTHGTDTPDNIDSMMRQGLRAPGQHTEIAAAWSFPLDKSLGLNNYVYMNWGIPDVDYGRHHVLVAAEALLQNTVVTPMDIVKLLSCSIFDRDSAYPDLSEAKQDHIRDHYFGSMVTGNAWLEIAARNVRRHRQAYPSQPYPVLRIAGMGEVKRFSTVQQHEIIGRYVITAETKTESSSFVRWKQKMLERGIEIRNETPPAYLHVPPKGTICNCVTHPFMQ